MTLEELHGRVRAFVAERDWARYHSPRNLAMALSVEAAELLELYLWTADGDPPTPERTARAADEAADVMICLLNLCDRAGIDLGQAVIAKLGRAAEKYPADQVRGRALKYDQYPTWDGTRHTERHRLEEASIPGDLPEAARRVLVDRGVPAERTLPARLGPTFTSALGSGRLRRPGSGAGYVFGEIRGTAGPTAELVVRVPEGDVVLVDLGDDRVRTVNRSLLAFVDALDLLEQVRAIDPGAFDDRDGFWTMGAEGSAG